MKEHATLFQADMVRALLRAQKPKTQTRRLPTTHNSLVDGSRASAALWADLDFSKAWVDQGPSPAGNAGPYLKVPRRSEETVHRVYPMWAPGDRLWVRENGWERPYRTPQQMREGADTWPPYEYDAEPVCCWEDGELKRLGWKRRPSIHMPRWACRIELEVTIVRVERLKDINGLDAMAEGLVDTGYEGARWHWQAGAKAGYFAPWRAYRALWDSINGPGSWDANPLVWVREFRRIKP